MNSNTLIQLATLMSVVAGVIGLLVSVRAYKRQVSALFLLEYTRRVDEMRQSLPPSVWGANIFPDAETSEHSNDLRLGVLRCLSLLAQLNYFCRTGYIPKQVWRMGQSEHKRILRSPLFMREWQALAPMFTFDRQFCRYVARVQQATDGNVDAANTPQSSRHEMGR